MTDGEWQKDAAEDAGEETEGVCGPDERDHDLSWDAPGLPEDHVPQPASRLWLLGGTLALLAALAAVLLPLLLVASR